MNIGVPANAGLRFFLLPAHLTCAKKTSWAPTFAGVTI